MATLAPALSRVTQAKRQLHLDWAEGVHLVGNTGLTIPELRATAAADRWQLASRFRNQAVRLLRSQPSMPRDAISRGYYSMYHAMRAVVLIAHGGDDHQAHAALPRNVPADLPGHQLWANALKSARERRNAADYNPYPKSPQAWKRDAQDVVDSASQFLKASKKYLIVKGCDLA